MRITFSPTHIYDTVDATEFLLLFARMNAVSLHEPLVSVWGAKNLLASIAITERGVSLDPNLPDEEFVREASEIGLFTLDFPG